MEKSRAIELLKLAVPIKALTQQEYSDFVEAVNMGMDALEQPTSPDAIDRKAAIDIFDDYNISVENGELEAYSRDRKRLCELPPAQPEPAIPVAWIEGQIERLNNTDNYFAELTANIIKTMLNEWRKGEQK